MTAFSGLVVKLSEAVFRPMFLKVLVLVLPQTNKYSSGGPQMWGGGGGGGRVCPPIQFRDLHKCDGSDTYQFVSPWRCVFKDGHVCVFNAAAGLGQPQRFPWRQTHLLLPPH